MTPGMPLAKRHILSDYHRISNRLQQLHPDEQLDGIIYVETDRRYDVRCIGDLSTWAYGPLDEIKFLRSIVETESGSNTLAGIVIWAPMHRKPAVLSEWLSLAKRIAGPKTWHRIKGCRFLLQAILTRDDFERLVLSEAFVTNLRLLGQKGYSFDVGIDQRSAGAWQLEIMARAMKAAHTGVPEGQRVVFILNHLCKPDFASHGPERDKWVRGMAALSSIERTYVKLSGAFSELSNSIDGSQRSAVDVAAWIKDWAAHVFSCFGVDRIMFGSDWPICNLKGPRSEDSWVVWKEVVETLLGDPDFGLDETARQAVWQTTAVKAYRLGGE
ncbi:hypothetical protein K431DRAFT_256512 [Polychaeton citri CBS 116435]|uniref:Amidohydrolase-related domain-containing protein n=1 Tax=Polychaeton citri CBS 116435 TaxID=1314669 RepID=A0A9P4UL28_9PEZI|nr:hypothetical protein K431DRAFT_256512 [Polychaeton citri CBS 116435]